MIYDYVYIIWLIASDVYTRTFNATCAVSRLTAGKCKLLGAWLAPWPRPKGRAGWRGSQHQGVFKRQRLAQAFGARWLPASLTWRSGELTWDSPVKKWPRLCHLGGQPKIWPVLSKRSVSSWEFTAPHRMGTMTILSTETWGPRMAFTMFVTVRLPGVGFEKPGAIAVNWFMLTDGDCRRRQQWWRAHTWRTWGQIWERKPSAQQHGRRRRRCPLAVGWTQPCLVRPALVEKKWRWIRDQGKGLGAHEVSRDPWGGI